MGDAFAVLMMLGRVHTWVEVAAFLVVLRTKKRRGSWGEGMRILYLCEGGEGTGWRRERKGDGMESSDGGRDGGIEGWMEGEM